ncbi:MAG: hypothetical protein LUG99_10920 [Lachnospiraceae bacterium]|nr:hypothetical protein [Lachnospiraceae bacterium]
MQEMQNNINKIYLLLFFFIVPIKYSNYLTIGFFLISMLILAIAAFYTSTVTRLMFGLFSFLGIAVLVVIVLSNFSYTNTVMVFIYMLIIAYAYNSENEYLNNSESFDWFYWIAYIAICIQLLVQVSANGIGMDMFTLQSGCWDGNYTYVALFSYYIYADAKKHKSWIPLAIATSYFNRSRRGLFLMFALFIIIKLIKYFRNKNNPSDLPKEKVSFSKCLGIISGTTIITIIFSAIWITFISATGTVSYHEGLNDGSNAVRFGANIYAIETVLNNKEFLFYGYDNNIQEALGDNVSENTFVTYNGYRLVQSHNSVINMLMKNGVIFTILYYLIFCYILSKYFQVKYIEYWIPYLVNAMIMHSMFTTDYLLLFVIGMSAVYEADKRREESISSELLFESGDNIELEKLED